MLCISCKLISVLIHIIKTLSMSWIIGILYIWAWSWCHFEQHSTSWVLAISLNRWAWHNLEPSWNIFFLKGRYIQINQYLRRDIKGQNDLSFISWHSSSLRSGRARPSLAADWFYRPDDRRFSESIANFQSQWEIFNVASNSLRVFLQHVL